MSIYNSNSRQCNKGIVLIQKILAIVEKNQTILDPGSLEDLVYAGAILEPIYAFVFNFCFLEGSM